MANYYATARSNYFAVKDETAFRQWANGLSLTILGPNHRNKVADGVDRFGITPDEYAESGWPNFRHNEETDEDDDDFEQLISSLDDEFLPDVDLAHSDLSYTVVRGEVLGYWEAHGENEA